MLHSSWNWELISDKTLDWWLPRIGRIKRAHACARGVHHGGLGQRCELSHWQTLARACQDEGADALELNLSSAHGSARHGVQHRPGRGADRDRVRAVKEVARVPVWAKLTPSTADIAVEARGAFLGGADAISSSNTFPSLPLVDPETLEFEMNVDGFVSSGGLGGPAIPPLVAGEVAQLTKAFPDKSFSGIGGVAEFRAHATSSSAAARSRCAPPRCSITLSARTW